MPSHIPKTPLSTPLSGSAREAEARIHSIFQGPKKRPPVILMVLAAALIVLCGSLVAFSTAPVSPMVVMDVQYYDTNQNYIEIPGLAWPMDSQPNQAVEEINQALAGLKAEYQAVLSWDQDQLSGLPVYENQCLFYPSTTSRYLNLLFFRNTLQTGLNTGHILSLVYDLQEGRLVTVEEALELAGVTQQGLYEALSAQYDPQLVQDYPEAEIRIQDQSLEGFRIREDGGVVFYLTARVDDAEDSALDFVSGLDNLYIWQGGSFTYYDQYGPGSLVPLVPSGETDQLSPPLWCQWYFDDGQPEGGFAFPGKETGTAVPEGPLGVLFQRALEDGLAVDYSLSASLLVLEDWGDGLLGAAWVHDSYPRGYLTVGLLDPSGQTLAGPVFSRAKYGGRPNAAVFTQGDQRYLMYTFNGMHQGYTFGEAGVVTIEDGRFTWVWPVQGDVSDTSSQAFAQFQDYWEDHYALLCPGGLEVFQLNPDFGLYSGSSAQWSPAFVQQFCPSQLDLLPDGALEHVRAWLEEFTRSGPNPWDAANISASWRVTSLAQTKTHHPGQREGEISLALECLADNNDELYFSAILVYDPDGGQVTQVVDFAMEPLETLLSAPQTAEQHA